MQPVIYESLITCAEVRTHTFSTCISILHPPVYMNTRFPNKSPLTGMYIHKLTPIWMPEK